MKEAIRVSAQVDLPYLDEAKALERELLDLYDRLNGDSTRAERSQVVLPSIMRRVSHAYRGAIGSSYGPTQTHRQSYEIGRTAFQELRQQLATLLDRDLLQLKQKLDEAGVPWTAGRALPAPEAE